jgi:hypothetical protein
MPPAPRFWCAIMRSALPSTSPNMWIIWTEE